jgi:hypothetical protein
LAISLKRYKKEPGRSRVLVSFLEPHSALATLPGVLLTALSRFAARLSGISLSALSRILLSGIPLTALSRFAARLPRILLVILARALSGLALLLLDFLSVFLIHRFLHRHRHENVRSTKTRDRSTAPAAIHRRSRGGRQETEIPMQLVLSARHRLFE